MATDPLIGDTPAGTTLVGYGAGQGLDGLSRPEQSSYRTPSTVEGPHVARERATRNAEFTLPAPPQIHVVAPESARSLSKISLPPPGSRLLPGHDLGRYELLCPIAQGGMAQVWVARLRGAHGFEKLVALKTILGEHANDPRYEAMFLDEARLVGGIRHHNVAEILDLGSSDSLLYLVLEWIEGDSLALLERSVARRRASLPIPVALRIVAQMCAGLHAAHELRDHSGKPLNVVHRDVSPQNVLLSATGEVKLIDFGIAKALDRIGDDTRTGVVKGKISYMSPEQALGQPLDRRTDIWAAGVVLYRLLSGRLPFRGENQLDTLHLISKRTRPPAIPALPRPVARLLDAVLEPDRERRIGSAAELETELEKLVAKFGSVTTRDVAAVVEKHLGKRIRARREIVETALRAADSRIKLAREFDEALQHNADSTLSGGNTPVAPRPVVTQPVVVLPQTVGWPVPQVAAESTPAPDQPPQPRRGPPLALAFGLSLAAVLVLALRPPSGPAAATPPSLPPAPLAAPPPATANLIMGALPVASASATVDPLPPALPSPPSPSVTTARPPVGHKGRSIAKVPQAKPRASNDVLSTFAERK